MTPPPPDPANSDGSLIASYLSNGDELAGETLIKRHGRSVYRFLYSMLNNVQDSEDLCQVTFTKAFAALPTYQDKNQFRSWLFRIAKNEALGLLRKRKSRPQITREITEADIETTPSTIQSRDSVAVISQAIDQLPPEERQVMILRMQEELSFREIAELTDTPLGTILSRMHEARKKLRLTLKPFLQ